MRAEHDRCAQIDASGAGIRPHLRNGAAPACDDAPVMLHPVMCAFCGEGVEETGLDPCGLIVIAGWAGPDEQQSEQQFFSHAGCLRTRMHPDVAVHAGVLEHRGS
jgi:hypothetical protein